MKENICMKRGRAKVTGKHEYELPVAVEFEIVSAPKIEQIEPTALRVEIKANARKINKAARTIKKDTKRLLRTLDKMERHGWCVVDQENRGHGVQRIKKLILDSEILCNSCGESTSSYCAEALADYLVANGVKTDGEEDTEK